MTESTAFERLEIQFKRAPSLQAMPGTLLSLIRSIDAGNCSAQDLERLIVADQALCAEFLRIASVASQAHGSHALSSVRGGIMLLGQRAVKSLATTMLIKSVVSSKQISRSFDPASFGRQTLVTGLVAQYAFARKLKLGSTESDWSAEEVFAAGVLSELGEALLAVIDPSIYDRCHSFAVRSNLSFDNAFFTLYGAHTNQLGVTAAKSWGMQPIFVTVLNHVREPWQANSEFTALCCINYAAHVANRFGFVSLPGQACALAPDVEIEVQIPEEELNLVMDVFRGRVEEFFAGSRVKVAA